MQIKPIDLTVSKVPYKQQKKIFFKKLKEIQAAHKPDKWGPRKNKQWKKEWEPFIKYDWDFDHSFLLDLIIYKLEKMRLNLTMFSTATPDWFERIDAEIGHAIELGKKLQTYDYEEQTHQFLREHTIPCVVIYKKNDVVGAAPLARISVPRTGDILDDFRSCEADKWCLDNGYDKKDVTYAYSSDWDDPNNYKIWKKMIRADIKAEQKDRDAFFLFISRHMKGWWD